jgi:hypothetical protein
VVDDCGSARALSGGGAAKAMTRCIGVIISGHTRRCLSQDKNARARSERLHTLLG